MSRDHTISNWPRARGPVLAVLLGVAPALLTAVEVRAQGMNMPGMEEKGAPKGDLKTATGTGTVAALNPANNKITFAHGPMPEIGWRAMKMEFPVAAGVDLSKVKAGDRVRFTVRGSGSSYTVQSISPLP